MDKSFIKKIRVPLINTICILIVLIFYLMEPLLPIMFGKWIFYIGIALGAIPIILQLIFTKIENEKLTKITKIYNEYYQVLMVAVIVVEVVFTFLMFPATVQQTSMFPTLSPSDNLIVRRSYDIDNNDIIVFEYDENIQKPNVGIKNGELLIKRAIVIPGQSFYYKDNKLFINDVEANDKFAVPEMNGISLEDICKLNNKTDECLKDGKYVLPDGWFVVFGDNRKYNIGGEIPISIDSRTFGLVHESQIYGRVAYLMKSILKWEKI